MLFISIVIIAFRCTLQPISNKDLRRDKSPPHLIRTLVLPLTLVDMITYDPILHPRNPTSQILSIIAEKLKVTRRPLHEILDLLIPQEERDEHKWPTPAEHSVCEIVYVRERAPV